MIIKKRISTTHIPLTDVQCVHEALRLGIKHKQINEIIKATYSKTHYMLRAEKKNKYVSLKSSERKLLHDAIATSTITLPCSAHLKVNDTLYIERAYVDVRTLDSLTSQYYELHEAARRAVYEYCKESNLEAIKITSNE